MVLGQKN
jgi:hypothetical protein